MTWDTIQQVLRIVLYAVGGWAFGDTVTSGVDFQNAASGVISIGAFAWWWYWNQKTPTKT